MMKHGAQSVMISGATKTLMWCAGSSNSGTKVRIDFSNVYSSRYNRVFSLVQNVIYTINIRTRQDSDDLLLRKINFSRISHPGCFIVCESLQVLPLSGLLVSVREWAPSYSTMCNVLEMKRDSLIVLPTNSGSTTAVTLRMPVSGVCRSHVSDSICLCLCHLVSRCACVILCMCIENLNKKL